MFNSVKTCLCITVVTGSHRGDSDDDGDFKHVCTIAVFLLVKLFYLLIHLLNYLFKFIQILIMLINFIYFIIISSLIISYSLNSFLKLAFLY